MATEDEILASVLPERTVAELKVISDWQKSMGLSGDYKRIIASAVFGDYDEMMRLPDNADFTKWFKRYTEKNVRCNR